MDYKFLEDKVRRLIETNKDKKIIIYPMGRNGMLVKQMLNEQMGIQEAFMLDNYLCKKSELIYPISLLEEIRREEYFVIVTCENNKFLKEIINSLKPYNIAYCNLFTLFQSSNEKLIPENYSRNIIKDKLKAEREICDMLRSGYPFAVGRLGNTECEIAYEYCRMRLGVLHSFSRNTSRWLLTTSGFFSSDLKVMEDIERYAEMTINSISDMDIHLVWNRDGEAFLLRNYAGREAQFIAKDIIHHPWRLQGPTWMNGLYKKKVLVVSPFSESIKIQYDRRRELFDNENNLPDFELITYQSLETQMDDNKGFENWFDAYQHMESEILQIQFDVALIGCGAYGYPLTAAIKRAGKQAIEMCSSIQLMFGIKGKRWVENKDFTKWWNDAWQYPIEKPPLHYKEIEGGCYWG